MLLSLLGKKFDYKDCSYTLEPFGIHPKIADFTNTNTNLYMTNNYTLFNMGLGWLLNYILTFCLHICKKLEEPDKDITGFQQFYNLLRITDNMIGGHDLRYSNDNKKKWTLACKNVLKVLQWMINKSSKLDELQCNRELKVNTVPEEKLDNE